MVSQYREDGKQGKDNSFEKSHFPAHEEKGKEAVTSFSIKVAFSLETIRAPRHRSRAARLPVNDSLRGCRVVPEFKGEGDMGRSGVRSAMNLLDTVGSCHTHTHKEEKVKKEKNRYTDIDKLHRLTGRYNYRILRIQYTIEMNSLEYYYVSFGVI